MNIIEVDCDDFAEIKAESTVLDSCILPTGIVMYVAEYQGSDWIFFFDPASNGALLIDSNDSEYGGSTHDHIRYGRQLGTV